MDRRDALKKMGAGFLGTLVDLPLESLKPPPPVVTAAPAVASLAARSNILQLVIAKGVADSSKGLAASLSLLESRAICDPYDVLVSLTEGIKSVANKPINNSLLQRYLGPNLQSRLETLLGNEESPSKTLEHYWQILDEEGQIVTIADSPMIQDRNGLTKGELMLANVRRTRWIPKPTPTRSNIESRFDLKPPTQISDQLREVLAPIHELSSRLAKFRDEAGNILQGTDPASTLVNNLYKLVQSNRWDAVYNSPELQVIIKFQHLWLERESYRDTLLAEIERQLTLFGLDINRVAIADAKIGLPSEKHPLIPQLFFALAESENYFCEARSIGSFPPQLRRIISELASEFDPRKCRRSLAARLALAKSLVERYPDGEFADDY